MRYTRYVTCLLITLAFTRLLIGQSLSDEAFRDLHQKLKPSADEPWRTIPWHTSVLAAQRLAAKENKPIFIWAMDGHPLGCT